MDPTPKFRRGDDPVPPPAPEPDEIEVEAALPEPLTAEERDQRLEVIKAEITEAHTRYKKNAQGALPIRNADGSAPHRG